MTHQTRITPNPDGGVILHLPDVTYIDTQVWSADVGLTDAGLTALRALLAGQAPATDKTAEAELTAEEARALADDFGLQLYRAQDALAFVGECCDIADHKQRTITTADVREWLKGARCGRQLAADGADHTASDPAADQTTLRDRIADALADAEGWQWVPGFDKTKSPAYQGYLRQADAVMAVLPAPVDQAEAVLRVVETALGDTLVASARGEALAGIAAVLHTTPADQAAEERIEQAEADAELHARNTQAVARERESYRKAWKDEQQRRAKAEAEVKRLRADRAAVLREAAEELLAKAKRMAGKFNDSDVLHEDGPAATVATWKRAADRLRRMADETPAAPAVAVADCNAGPGWYEVISPRATTCIAYVHEDGSLYLPEGDALTAEKFAFAAARGNAHKLVRADDQPATKARQDDPRPSSPPA
ncbi:hypothetical protein ACF07S_10095 [Streptomyces sp. NPDC016640]|uniref:hypothetical protein n=1 Tax=Streptomyces sp. NPDC016640 TaxID=3364969 RepID=UPI003700B12C